MKEALQAVHILGRQALDLLSALFDFLRTSSVSLPVPAFFGLSVVAFLMGLILGRISKRKDREGSESWRQGRDDRIVLDLERLTPLGLSAEEEAEADVMDITSVRAEQTAGGAPARNVGEAQQRQTAPRRLDSNPV